MQFTIAEARRLIPDVRRHTDRLVTLRADLAEAQLALHHGDMPAVGGLPEVKALEARLQEAFDWFAERGIELKGIAPVLADFPSEIDGEAVLLCWLEGEPSLEWYHRAETGFAGRRRLADPP